MTKIVGIRFHKAGKIYYFDPVDFELETAMHVIVETARGIEMGTVLIPPKSVEDDKVVQPLKPVLRVATDEDEKKIEINKEKEKDAFAICKEKIIKHGLEMKLVNAEYTFDGNKLLFYFTADGRIDFRELVKDLAAVFRTRIELRQIGVRDETKLLGGIGICGRELCCSTYLSDFVPVSIKMAKEQNLSLNPTKISGVCGRLMCCLKNEQETYEYLNSRLPSIGDVVTTPDGIKGEVTNINVLRQLVKVIVDNGSEKELREYSIDDLKFKSHKRKDVTITEEELKELEGLEEEGTEVTKEEERREKPRNKDNRNSHNARNNRDNNSRDNYNKDNNRDNNSRDNYNKDNNRDNNRDNGDRENSRDSHREGGKDVNSRENGRENNRTHRGGNREYNRDNRENRENRGNREYNRDNRENRGNREYNRDNRENRGNREYNRDNHENKDNRDNKDGRNHYNNNRRRNKGKRYNNGNGKSKQSDQKS